MRNRGVTVFSDQQQWLLGRVRLTLDHYRLGNVAFWLPLACLLTAALGSWAFVIRRLPRFAFVFLLVLVTVGNLNVVGRNIVPQVNLQSYPLDPPVEILRGLFVPHWNRLACCGIGWHDR